MEAAVVAGSAALASFLSGLLGIGGGVVLAPLLLYVPPALGAEAIEVKLITGLTMVQAISASLFGAVRHRGYGNVSTRVLRIMGPAIAVASLAGALVSRATPDRVLLLVFAAVALATAGALLVPGRPQTVAVGELEVNVPLAVGIAGGLGFFAGMVGIAAVAFYTAALIHLLRIPPRVAIGTSLGIGALSAVGGFIGKAATAQVEPFLGAVVFVAALLVSPIGAAISVRTPTRALTTILAAVVGVAALRIAWTGLTGQ